jgi:hypothetical protein
MNLWSSPRPARPANGSPPKPAWPGPPPPEHSAEQVAQVHVLEREVLAAGCARALPRTAGKGVLADLVAAGVDFAAVEARALGRVAQDVIGGVYLLEALLGFLVAGVKVRMRLLRQAAESLLDVLVAGGRCDAQRLIGVFGHGAALVPPTRNR